MELSLQYDCYLNLCIGILETNDHEALSRKQIRHENRKLNETLNELDKDPNFIINAKVNYLKDSNFIITNPISLSKDSNFLPFQTQIHQLKIQTTDT